MLFSLPQSPFSLFRNSLHPFLCFVYHKNSFSISFLKALDVDGSGSLSRADILDLVESEGNGGSKEPFAEPSAASSAEVQIVTAKRSAVVGAKLALNEAMASASDSTKVEFFESMLYVCRLLFCRCYCYWCCYNLAVFTFVLIVATFIFHLLYHFP